MPTIPVDFNYNSQENNCLIKKSRANFHWYALQIKTKSAGAVHETLVAKGYESFLPLYRTQRRWSDRVKQLDVPLFPGYLFCRFNAAETLAVVTTPGTIGIVGAAGKPIVVEENEIAAVRAVLKSGLSTETWPFLEVGERVRINGGPLAGLEGILAAVGKNNRLVVSISLLRRSVAVEIDRRWASPLSNPANRQIQIISEETPETDDACPRRTH